MPCPAPPDSNLPRDDLLQTWRPPKRSAAPLPHRRRRRRNADADKARRVPKRLAAALLAAAAYSAIGIAGIRPDRGLGDRGAARRIADPMISASASGARTAAAASVRSTAGGRALATPTARPRVHFCGLGGFPPVLGRRVRRYRPKDEESGWQYGPREYYGKNRFDPPIDASSCVPMKRWQTQSHPNCNAFHDIDWYDDDVSLFDEGGWRKAINFKRRAYGQKREAVVLKVVHWEKVDFDRDTFEIHRVDAVISERLSPGRTVEIYGHCSTSAVYQKASYKTASSIFKRNKLLPAEKLERAAEIARSLADLHNLDEEGNATVAHRDLKPYNVLLLNGRFQITDFNDSTLLMWNTTSNRQCFFSYNGFPANPQWGAGFKPREQAVNEYPLTEKIDVYALGGILYLILTGKQPFQVPEMTDEEKKKAVLEGALPHIPSKYTESEDMAIRGLVGSIKKCYAVNPEDRPSSREVETDLTAVIGASHEKTKL